MQIKLRPYQQKAANLAVARVLEGKDPLVALPTGAGKTYTIAAIIQQLQAAGNENFLILSHVKEILHQNQVSIEKALSQHVSVYSAGLDRKQIGKITVAGIQSAYRKPNKFKHFNVVIIDEAHLISKRSESMYHKFFEAIGDHTKIGLTATPFRLGSGYIYGKDQLFDCLAYDCTSKEEFNKLVDNGYLCDLITKGTRTKLSVEGVGTVGGDYNERQLSAENDRDEITNECIREIIARGSDRKKWLIFAIDIDHAEHIAEGLIRCGISTMVIHSKMDQDRDQIIRRFKDGNYRCIVNVNILTTGFDVPDIDLIGLLRPTKSPVLHVQTIGRGMRIAPDKSNCLVLDFAGNITRLGPINDVNITKKKKGGTGSDMVKECPVCSLLVHIKTKLCPECEFEFKFKINLDPKLGISSPINRPKNNMIWIKVDDINYSRNKKPFGPPTVKVSYQCEGVEINEWLCPEHTGYAQFKAHEIMKKAGNMIVNTVQEFLENVDKFRKPRKILVNIENKYPEVKERIY
jgi:DNA repair protein RadD